MLRRITSARYAPAQAPAEPQPAEVKPSDKAPVNRRRALGDITNAYANDDVKEHNKKPLFAPAGISQSEIGLEEMENVVEVENDRIYMQRPSDDIDSRDNGNPLLASSYVGLMFDHFHALEKEYKVNPSYMANQPYINDRMRCILIDWLVSNVLA